MQISQAWRTHCFAAFQANTDYMRQKALEAMSSPPVASEVRIPTDTWSGLYFSRSMPAQEMKKLQGKEQYKQQLATTYEVWMCCTTWHQYFSMINLAWFFASFQNADKPSKIYC